MAALSDSERRYPPPFQGWYAIAVFSVAAVLSYTDRQILTLLVDPIRGDLHISDTQVSLLQGAAFAVLYACVGLPLGRIADVVPRKTLLIAAVTLWSLATVACGLAGSFGQLLVARLFVGVGEAAFAPAVMSLIADLFPPERRAGATGVFFTGIAIGAGSALAIGGALLQLAQQGSFANLPLVAALAPWRVVLVLAGGSGILVAALLTTLREPVVRRFAFKELRARLAFREAARPFRERLPLLYPLYAAMAFSALVDYAILSWTPALLSRQFAFSAIETGASLGAIAVACGLLGTPAGGFLTDWATTRWGLVARPRLALAIALGGVLAAPIGLATSGAAALAAVAWWLGLSSLLGIISIATVLDLLPAESRGLATATIAFNNTIVGLGIGPTVVALTKDHLYGSEAALGPALSTVVAPAILLSCVFYYLALQRWDRTLAALSWKAA